MAQTLLLDNEYATLVYDDTDHYLYHTFHQPITGNELRNIINPATDFLAEHKLTKWLSDDRKNGEMSHEDIIYALEVWGPRTAAAGWKFWALVVPESVAGRASMQDLVNAYFAMGVRVAVFSNLEEARHWLVTR